MKPVSTTRKGTVSMKLYTIGYKGKNAKELFGILSENKVRKVLDVRRKNADCYCFYTHKRDFPFLLNLAGIAYEPKREWAPEQWLLDGYRDKEVTWIQYVVEFRKEINERNILRGVTAEDLDVCVLLCSEKTAGTCLQRISLFVMCLFWVGGMSVVGR